MLEDSLGTMETDTFVTLCSQVRGRAQPRPALPLPCPPLPLAQGASPRPPVG